MLSTSIMIIRHLLSARPLAPVHARLLRIPRTIHSATHHTTGRRPCDPPNPVSHGPENYFVDVDDTPAPDASVYRVDPTSDAAESAYEPPSGPWSRSGVETSEYETMSQDEPYDVPHGGDAKLRYGAMKRYMQDESPETSTGPQGSERWGRKPKGRA